MAEGKIHVGMSRKLGSMGYFTYLYMRYIGGNNPPNIKNSTGMSCWHLPMTDPWETGIFTNIFGSFSWWHGVNVGKPTLHG